MRRLTWALSALVILLAVWPLLVGQRFAFRDVSHFYLPLYDYVAERTATEWLPLWNPLDHTGIPLIGESTTAVLYPLRYIVFALPVSAEIAMNVYVIIHLLIASAGAARLAKRSGCSSAGIFTASIVYPMSGSVLALACNPPFLVGASWIPFVLSACLRCQPEKRVQGDLQRDFVMATFALSMMVLGGDPQTALHCTLVVVSTCIIQQVFRRKDSGMAAGRLMCFAAAAVLSIGVCAIQVAASVDWSMQSDRVAEASRANQTYDFSIAPWHTLEIITPRPFGDPFPQNQRLSKIIPGDGRMWTPTIYAGLVVGIALVFRALDPRRYFECPWFAISVVSLLLSFGHFTLVWILQQIPGVLETVPSALGGPYWLLQQILPGYDAFRYPAKWLPIFSVASAMVAARWVSSASTPQEKRSLLVMGAMIVAGLVCVQILLHASVLGKIPVKPETSDEFWGPLDVKGGLETARLSLAWTALMLLSLGWTRQAAYKRPSIYCACLVAFLVCVDAVVTSQGILPTVDIHLEQRLAHQASPSTVSLDRTLRTQSGLWPQRWKERRSEDRALEVAASERIAWFGRWHLSQRQAVFNSMSSIRSRAIADFWSASERNLRGVSPEAREGYWNSARSWLSIDGLSHTDGSRFVGADGRYLVYVDRVKEGKPESVRVFIEWRPERSMQDLAVLLRDSNTLLLPHVAIPPPSQNRSGQATVESLDNGSLIVRCELDCVVERTVYQDGNWRARLRSTESGETLEPRVCRSSQLNQAVAVPKGEWVLEFEYRPWWKWPSIVLSAISIATLFFVSVWTIAFRRPRNDDVARLS